jgi:AhpC/TSA family
VTFSFSATYLALWVIAVLQALVTLVILQQLGRVRELAEKGKIRLEHLPIGSTAPDFMAVDERSGVQIDSRRFDEQEAVLLFLAADCQTCQSLVASFGEVRLERFSTIVAFCRGDHQDCAELVAHLSPLVKVVHDETGGTADRYGVSGYPTAVIVTKEGKIGAYTQPSDREDLITAISAYFAEGTNSVPPDSSLFPRLENSIR